MVKELDFIPNTESIAKEKVSFSEYKVPKGKVGDRVICYCLTDGGRRGAGPDTGAGGEFLVKLAWIRKRFGRVKQRLTVRCLLRTHNRVSYRSKRPIVFI